MPSKRTGTGQDSTRGRTVQEDWFAWLPDEMDPLFGATRIELASSNVILNVALDEGLALCEREQFTLAKERVIAFAELFDRLAIRLRLVIRTIEDHGSHFETLPNVTALDPKNFRGTTAQRISFMDSLFGKVVFRGRTRFFHKLHALKEIIEELQKETRIIVEDVSDGWPVSPYRAFDGPSRDMSDSHRDPSYSRPTREVSGSTSGASLSGFFREISESPRMKFGIAWGSFGMLAVPLAALVAGGMAERVALFILLGAILPVQYVIFVASKNLVATSRRTVAPDEESSHEEAFPKERPKFEPTIDTRVWKELEVLGYDLNTCMGETTVVLKSFFCALPADELEAFRQKLVTLVPALLTVNPRRP